MAIKDGKTYRVEFCETESPTHINYREWSTYCYQPMAENVARRECSATYPGGMAHMAGNSCWRVVDVQRNVVTWAGKSTVAIPETDMRNYSISPRIRSNTVPVCTTLTVPDSGRIYKLAWQAGTTRLATVHVYVRGLGRRRHWRRLNPSTQWTYLNHLAKRLDVGPDWNAAP